MALAATMPHCSLERCRDVDKVLITGATGFIGSHVAEVFLSAGIPCVLFVRDPSRLCHELSGKAEIRTGNVCNRQSVMKASRDCTSLIHVAGKSSDWGNREDFFSLNVQGTINMLEACRINRISYAILTGSISSYGEENCTLLKDETFPFNSHYPYFLDRFFPCAFNHYRDSKAEATRQAMLFAAEHRINMTIIEPAWVYGEREFTTGFYAYIKTVEQGVRFLPGSLRNTFHVIYARDLARAYLLAWQKQLPGIERILIGNSEPESMHRIFSLFCSKAGLKPPRPIPRGAAYPAGFVLEVFGTLFRTKNPPLLSRGRVNMFYDSIGYSVKKAERILGFTSEYSLEQGIRNTVTWYQENGYLKRKR
jgi:nucleoside-diphosphate-sugar epimerase